MSGRNGPDTVNGSEREGAANGKDKPGQMNGADPASTAKEFGEIYAKDEMKAGGGNLGMGSANSQNDPGAMGPKARRAYDLFLQGCNCAQSVAGAFAGEMGLPLETVMRMASGFGGGIGRLRETCGTVSGMVLAAGMLRGYGTPETGEKKTQTYAMIQELVARFRAANDTIVCRELLGLAAPEGTPQAEARTPEYYRKRPCPRLAAQAAGILEAYLAETAGEKDGR